MTSRRTLVLDNEDSFTWNLVDLLRRTGDDPLVVRSSAPLPSMQPRRCLVSPGPGSPSLAPVAMDLIGRWATRVPFLGVCLGHQCLGEFFGMKTIKAPEALHGKTSHIHHDGRGIFKNIPQALVAMRYHSLVLDSQNIPEDLEVSATFDDGAQQLIMGIRHRFLPVEGVQFHPESFLTDHGETMIRNFLSWSSQ